MLLITHFLYIIYVPVVVLEKWRVSLVGPTSLERSLHEIVPQIAIDRPL